MNLHYKLKFTLIACLFLASACSQQEKPSNNLINESEIEESLLKANRYLLRAEEEDINDFIKRYQWKMTASGTGLRYQIDPIGSGDRIQYGNFVKIHYTVKLLDGNIIYSSDIDGVKQFIAGKGGVESGLEEGIKLLRKGDRAKFVLPSHLAFGLLGDSKKIPPRSPIVYELQIIDIQ